MSDLGRGLILIGGVLILSGVLVLLAGKIPGFGKLPGDILIKKENFSFYFPLTTCLLLSVFLSFLFYLWNQR